MKCKICKTEDATKTNSHIIPSFLLGMVSNFDHKSGRDKELLFSVSDSHTAVHAGSRVPLEKLHEIFNPEDLTDDKISELIKNDAAKDFIYCPICEQRMSRYIETPYAQSLQKSKAAEGDVAMAFWVSVLYRMASENCIKPNIKNKQIEKLRVKLNTYLRARENKQKYRFTGLKYKILYCPKYSYSVNGGIIHLNVTKSGNVLGFFGDFIVYFKITTFSHLNLDLKDLSIFEAFTIAQWNDSRQKEIQHTVSSDIFKSMYDVIAQRLAQTRVLNEYKIANSVWHLAGQLGNVPESVFKKYQHETSLIDKVGTAQDINYKSKALANAILSFINRKSYKSFKNRQK